MSKVIQYPLKDVVTGYYQDIITRYDGDEIVEQIVTPLAKNIITTPISIWVAGLVKGDLAGNNSYWAVGTGSQTSSPFLTGLVAEYNRKKVAISYVDNNNAITTTPGGRLVMNVSWAKGELGTVTLTEFGLFGGTDAAQAGAGLMIDYVPHGPLSLDSTLSLARNIYFSF